MPHGSSVDIVLLDSDLRTESGGELTSAARRADYKGRFLMIAESTVKSVADSGERSHGQHPDHSLSRDQ
jgi:hypothetical protein